MVKLNKTDLTDLNAQLNIMRSNLSQLQGTDWKVQMRKINTQKQLIREIEANGET